MKTLGNYTATATKAIKAGNCIICNKAEDGYIYTANGFFIFKMTPPEYDAFIRPAAGCDPGNWNIDNKGNREELRPGQMDIIKIFNDALGQINGSTTATACKRSPLEFTSEKMTLTGFYNPAADVAAFYNKLYITSFSGGTLHATKATAAAVVMEGEDALAMILPVRPDAAKSRAVKAYFTEPSDAEQKNNNAEQLQQLQQQNAEQAEQLQRAEAMREALANKITELCDEITSRNNEIESLKKQIEQQPAAALAATEQPAPDLKTAAEMIAERFRAFAGVEAVIKGATTSAPVVWLKGNTKQHENEITAAGAKWSGKKSAYYIKVA